MHQAMARLEVPTPGRSMVEISADIDAWLDEIGAGNGLLTVFVRHTSASLTIQENADPDVQADLLDALDRLAPQSAGYRHSTEGADDMPAHIKGALTDVSLGIPVVGGRTECGTWQGIYLVEHRARPHRRTVTLHYLGT
ncbi:MAG: secondary thiamine-phosphate synthase enzyme [Hyphomicrobiales bacterium]|nr:MAG: secondary thiamine-phosphate synthase enzyme [Hyphomicrobiales bacterium]